ncbi:MAG TPA: malonic semialdehyde reductase [Gammaproteobacteria bacterium]|jgi:3-hydroxypropanoate dehydrogenase
MSLDQTALDALFLNARTHHAWRSKPVSDAQLVKLYELTRMGPTSMNSSPARFVFITSNEGREKLKPALSPGNVEQTMSAPLTVIVAHDSRFYEYLPKLAPHAKGAAEKFANNAGLAESTAFRNGSLQGAYLIMAARALGLDCGPMSGFNNAKVDEIFFPDGRWKSNFLVNIGYGDPAKLYPRAPRLDFDEACVVV